jgi:hypothetical protein
MVDMYNSAAVPVSDIFSNVKLRQKYHYDDELTEKIIPHAFQPNLPYHPQQFKKWPCAVNDKRLMMTYADFIQERFIAQSFPNNVRDIATSVLVYRDFSLTEEQQQERYNLSMKLARQYPYVWLMKKLTSMNNIRTALILGKEVLTTDCVIYLNLEARGLPYHHHIGLNEICLMKVAQIWRNSLEKITTQQLIQTTKDFQNEFKDTLTHWVISASKVLVKRIKDGSLGSLVKHMSANKEWSSEDIFIDLSNILNYLAMIDPTEHKRTARAASMLLNQHEILAWMKMNHFLQDKETYLVEKNIITLCQKLMGKSFYHCIKNVLPAWLPTKKTKSNVLNMLQIYRKINSTTTENLNNREKSIQAQINKIQRKIIEKKNELVAQLHPLLDDHHGDNTTLQVSLTLALNEVLESYYRLTLLTNYFQTQVKYKKLMSRSDYVIREMITLLNPRGIENVKVNKFTQFLPTFLAIAPGWCNPITGLFDPKYNTLSLFVETNRAINTFYEMAVKNTHKASWIKASHDLSNVLIQSSIREFPNIDALNFFYYHPVSNNYISQVNDASFMRPLIRIYIKSIEERLIDLNCSKRLEYIFDVNFKKKLIDVTRSAQYKTNHEQVKFLKSINTAFRSQAFLNQRKLDADTVIKFLNSAFDSSNGGTSDSDVKITLLKKFAREVAWDFYTNITNNQIICDAFMLLVISLRLSYFSIYLSDQCGGKEKTTSIIREVVWGFNTNATSITYLVIETLLGFLIAPEGLKLFPLLISLTELIRIKADYNEADQSLVQNNNIKQRRKPVKKYKITKSKSHGTIPTNISRRSKTDITRQRADEKKKKNLLKHYKTIQQKWHQFECLLQSIDNTKKIKSNYFDHAKFLIELKKEINKYIDLNQTDLKIKNIINIYLKDKPESESEFISYRNQWVKKYVNIIQQLTQDRDSSIWDLFDYKGQENVSLDRLYEFNKSVNDSKRFKAFRLNFDNGLPDLDRYNLNELEMLLKPFIAKLIHCLVFIIAAGQLTNDKNAKSFINYFKRSLQIIAIALGDDYQRSLKEKISRYDKYSKTLFYDASVYIEANQRNEASAQSESENELEDDSSLDALETSSGDESVPEESDRLFDYRFDMFMLNNTLADNIEAFLSVILEDEPLEWIAKSLLEANRSQVDYLLTKDKFRRTLLNILELKSPTFIAKCNASTNIGTLNHILNAITLLEPDEEFKHLNRLLNLINKIKEEHDKERPLTRHKKSVASSLVTQLRGVFDPHNTSTLNPGARLEIISKIIVYLNSLDSKKATPHQHNHKNTQNPVVMRNCVLHQVAPDQYFSLYLQPAHRHYFAHKIFLLLNSKIFDKFAVLFRSIFYAQENQFSLKPGVLTELEALFTPKTVGDDDINEIISTWNQWHQMQKNDTEKLKLLKAIGVELIRHLDNCNKLTLIGDDANPSALYDIFRKMSYSQKKAVNANSTQHTENQKMSSGLGLKKSP